MIVRKERPHPGAQLRFTDIDGHRFTASPPTPGAGSSPTWNCGTAAGPAARTASAAPRTPACATCPLHGFAQNQIWCEIVALACELLAWMQMLALDRPRPPLGTQTAAAAAVLRRRAPRPRRPPPAAAPRRDLALGHPDHRRDHPPAGPRPRLTSRNRPCDQEGQPPGPVEPRPPGATAGQPGTAGR